MKNWEEEIVLPAKETGTEYAYILKSSSIPIKCDKETLLKVIETEENVEFVTTPKNSTFIIPGSDFETIKPILFKKKASVKQNIVYAFIYIILFGGLMLLFNFSHQGNDNQTNTEKLYLLIFGIIPMISNYYEFFTLNRINESNYKKESEEIKFDYWVKLKTSYSIYICTGLLVLIFTFQLPFEFKKSIELAGLIKQKVLVGEYWRVLTAPLLHGGLLHIFFNAFALFIIGRTAIRITGFSYFALVFLFSAILGSLFSLYLMPLGTSVGASGGIMGLIGFILVISIKFKDEIPRNIIKSMIQAIILVGLLGISASKIIDNAAHLGGLVGGILAGLVLIRNTNKRIPYKPTIFVKMLGALSSIILVLGVVMIFTSIFQNR